MAVIVRDAVVGDADAMGRVHVRAWREAYRGIVPDSVLAGLRPEERAAMWTRALGTPRPDRRVLVADDAGVVGFAAIGPAKEPDLGELGVLNVDPDHWGRGVGRALLTAAERGLRELGWTEIVLWVVGANARARRFYAAAGWAPDGAVGETRLFGEPVADVRYRRSV